MGIELKRDGIHNPRDYYSQFLAEVDSLAELVDDFYVSFGILFDGVSIVIGKLETPKKTREALSSSVSPSSSEIYRPASFTGIRYQPKDTSQMTFEEFLKNVAVVHKFLTEHKGMFVTLFSKTSPNSGANGPPTGGNNSTSSSSTPPPADPPAPPPADPRSGPSASDAANPSGAPGNATQMIVCAGAEEPCVVDDMDIDDMDCESSEGDVVSEYEEFLPEFHPYDCMDETHDDQNGDGDDDAAQRENGRRCMTPVPVSEASAISEEEIVQMKPKLEK